MTQNPSPQKDAEAIFRQALAYRDLEKPDLEKAKELYEEAVALNHPGAIFNLARMYQRGDFGESDLEKTKELYEKGVALNDASAAYNLALMYHRGDWVAPNIEKAKELYEKAAALNHARAIFNLGLMYKLGVFGEPDIEKAKTLFEQAIALKHTNSMFSLAIMYRDGIFGEPDIKKAEELLEQAAALDHDGAMFSLALMYQRGVGGVKPDIQKAKQFYEQASALGNTRAMFNLALMYQSDDLGKPDKSKAQELFASAAELGDGRARSFLQNPMIKAVVNQIKSEGVKLDIQQKVGSALESLEEVFFDLRSKHIVTEPIKLAHFTTWSAIENILSLSTSEKPKTCLRQYLVEYMNDPSEGQRLLNFIGISNSRKNSKARKISGQLQELFKDHYFALFEKHSCTTHLLPSVFTVSLTKESDRLDLWRAYGSDGLGYCLVLPIAYEGDHMVQVRNRDTSLEFMGEEVSFTPSRETATTPNDVPLLYWIRYSDEDVVDALNMLSFPLKSILDLKSEVSENAWNQIASCSTATLLELLYLYKDEQYSTEKEARALCVMRLDNPRVQLDERTPGYLFCETSEFLFNSSGSEVILGPKVLNSTGALWNIRYRLTKLGFADNTVVRKSQVPYR